MPCAEAVFFLLQGLVQFANQQEKFLRVLFGGSLFAENLPSFFFFIRH